MEKLDEVKIKELANTIVDNIFEEMAMMSMGGNSSTGSAMATTPAVATGEAKGSGDLGSTSSNSSNTDNSKNNIDKAQSLSNISTKLSALSSKATSAERGPHTGIVKDGKSFSVHSIIRAIKAPYSGSVLQTDGKAKLAGSGITSEKIN